MGTTHEVISDALFGGAQRAVLALLFGRPDEEFYLREIIRAVGVGQGAVQRELKRLVAAGLVTRRVRGRQVHFRANPDSPVFEELRGLLLKTAGAVEVLRSALAPLADRIRLAFIYGSVARGEERRQSDLDLLVVGDVSLGEVVKSLGPAQERLGREVNPTVYSEDEFRARIAAGRHFIKRVMAGAKVYVIGDEQDARNLGK